MTQLRLRDPNITAALLVEGAATLTDVLAADEAGGRVTFLLAGTPRAEEMITSYYRGSLEMNLLAYVDKRRHIANLMKSAHESGQIRLGTDRGVGR